MFQFNLICYYLFSSKNNMHKNNIFDKSINFFILFLIFWKVLLIWNLSIIFLNIAIFLNIFWGKVIWKLLKIRS